MSSSLEYIWRYRRYVLLVAGMYVLVASPTVDTSPKACINVRLWLRQADIEVADASLQMANREAKIDRAPGGYDAASAEDKDQLMKLQHNLDVAEWKREQLYRQFTGETVSLLDDSALDNRRGRKGPCCCASPTSRT